MSLRSVCKRTGIVVFTTLLLGMCGAGRVAAQGGEPRSFAIRGARVVPVSGAPLENATVLVSRGIITAVGTNVTIPADAWVIEGKGLIVYPGLVDAFTDVGVATAPASRGSGEANAKPPISKGPETGRRQLRGAMPRMKSTWAMRGSKAGAARDSRPRSPLPRAGCFQAKPRC